MNSKLKSLSHGWPTNKETDCFPTLAIKRKEKTKTPKERKPKKLRTIREDPPDDDGQHDDETQPSDSEPEFRDPVIDPELEDPNDEQVEEDDLDVDVIGDSDDDIPDETWEPSKEQRRDLEFAHDNSGHPSKADFARLLRRGNVDPKVVRWVKKNFRCETCEAHKRPSSRRPVAVPRTYRVSHVIGLDLILVKNLLGEREFWLNCVCWGSNFQLVQRLGDENQKKAKNVWGNFVEC